MSAPRSSFTRVAHVADAATAPNTTHREQLGMTDSVSRVDRFTRARASWVALLLTCAGCVAGCGDRDTWWDRYPSVQTTLAMSSGFVVVSTADDQAVVYNVAADLTLRPHTFDLGHNVTVTAADPVHDRAFIVTAGASYRRSADDEAPSLTILEGAGGTFTSRRLPLPNPADQLSMDSEGRWLVLWSTGGETGLITNPNELLLLDLQKPGANIVRFSLDSRDATTPLRLTFSPELHLPGGPRRLLVAQSYKDIHIVDLDHAGGDAPRPDLVVPLTSGGNTRVLTPEQVAFSDGGPATDDARIAVRLSGSSEVVTITLGAAALGSVSDFKPTVNFTDLGGTVSDLAFVRTTDGPRLAGLVATSSKAVLVDPETSVSTEVPLPARYDKFAVVTSDLPPETAQALDVVMLYGNSASVGLWSLGQTRETPWRSVDVITLDTPVAAVVQVPSPNAHLKIVKAGTSLHVLDLLRHSAAPLRMSGNGTSVDLSVSPTGQTAWVGRSSPNVLTGINLTSLALNSLIVDHSIDDVFDITRDQGRALVAFRKGGTCSATVFDGLNPTEAAARVHPSLLFSRP